MSETFREKGYSEEDRYFKEKEQELLRRKRQELSARDRHAHWMKCPKCGHDLEEIELSSVLVDRCPNCQGIFLDKGELDQLTTERQSGFFASLRKFFEATTP